MRQLIWSDRVISQLDAALRTLSPSAAQAARPNPSKGVQDSNDLSEAERKHAAGLMRINHTGEVCAQGLYQGQALTAKLTETRESMNHAAQEEEDHLAWCRDRLSELQSRPSLLNPVFYSLSYGIGATAGAISDRWSLGFVAATEDQVCKHLESHLTSLPESDQRSRAILKQMLTDEAQHAEQALAAGGLDFPKPVKQLMTLVSKAMTKTTYRI